MSSSGNQTVIKYWNMLFTEFLESFLEDTQNLAKHNPEQPGPGDSALRRWSWTSQSPELSSHLTLSVIL